MVFVKAKGWPYKCRFSKVLELTTLCHSRGVLASSESGPSFIKVIERILSRLGGTSRRWRFDTKILGDEFEGGADMDCPELHGTRLLGNPLVLRAYSSVVVTFKF